MFVLSLQFHILFKRCKALLSAPFLIPSPGSSSCVSVLSLSLSVPLSLHPSLSSSPRHTPNPRLSPRSHLTASHSRAPHSQQQAFGEVAGCWGGRLPTHPPHPKNRGMQVAAPPTNTLHLSGSQPLPLPQQQTAFRQDNTVASGMGYSGSPNLTNHPEMNPPNSTEKKRGKNKPYPVIKLTFGCWLLESLYLTDKYSLERKSCFVQEAHNWGRRWTYVQNTTLKSLLPQENL